MSAARPADERRRKLLQLASAAAFLAIVALAVLIVASESQTSGGDVSLEGVGEVNRELRGIPQDGMTLGSPRAKATLVEFGDLQCPACKAYAESVLPQVIHSKVRSGEARIEFRNFTILGEESVDAAAAALAAAEQGRGWHFVELFYANQGFEDTGYVTDDFMTAVAEAAGVAEIGRWDAARKSSRLRGQVAREAEQARQLGLTGTPSFAIEGPSAQGLEIVGLPEGAGALEEALEAARASTPK